MAYLKFGFHTGPTGPKPPLSFYQTLDNAGIPFTLKVTDAAPPLKALDLARNSDVEHTIIYRRSVGSQGGIGVYDVPDYNKTPQEAAIEHFNLHYQELPPEVVGYKDVCWIETINETNKDDDSVVEWTAEFSIYHSRLWHDRGFKYLCFGWAGGCPEAHQWRGEKMLELLRLCAQRPYTLGIALHEYSLNKDIWNGTAPDGSHWLVGRFEHLHAACDDHNIMRPFISITEWGWSKDDDNLPAQAQRLIDYKEVGELYAQHANISGAAVWCLNESPEWGNIHHHIVQDIAPLLDMTLNTTFSDPPAWPDEEQPPVEKHKAIIVKLPQDMTKTEWDAVVTDDEIFDNRHSVTASHNDMLWTLQGGNPDSYVKFSHPARDVASVAMVEDAGYRWEPLYDEPTEPTPGNPLIDLKLGYLFEYKYSDSYNGGRFNDPRDYDGDGVYDDKHEGLDADVIGGQADNVVDVLCTYDGVVERSLDSAGEYGKYIRVQHEKNGSIFYTRYCHLDVRFFEIGAHLDKGMPLGEVGSTGNVSGEHVHFNLEAPGYGMSGYVVADVVNPFPFLPAGNMELPPLVPPPPTGRQVAIRPYFEPPNKYGRKIVFRFPDGRTQPQQLKKLDDNTIALFKGDGQTIDGKFVHDYERFFFDTHGNMRRLEDTSVGGRKAYSQNSAVWLPHTITEGHTYTNTLIVTNYDRVTCEQLSEGPTTDYLTFAKFHETWVSPQNSDIVLEDVIQLEWRKSPNGNVEETYYLAEGIMYSAWNEGAIHEFADGQQPINGALWGCG